MHKHRMPVTAAPVLARRRVKAARLALALLLPMAAIAMTAAPAAATPVGPCGTSGAAPPVTHVIVVMMENRSYNQVIGSSAAPYQTALSGQCGTATAMFGATHTSAVNYLALSAGEYPASSPPGCGSVSACADPGPSLYTQLDAAGLTWRSYQESMPSACATKAASPYKLGHNPSIFYTSIPPAECKADDVGVPSLTAASGAFYNDLQAQTLPSFSWVTPNIDNDADSGGNAALTVADTWLSNFVPLVTSSPSYQAGNTLLLITYDEGTGSDYKVGENCTDQSLDMPVTNGRSAHQDSCHVPFLVVYPYTPAGATDGTFFDHYSVTKTVEDIYGLTYLSHAGDAQTSSLVGHFGIP
jgi:phospholipase C